MEWIERIIRPYSIIKKLQIRLFLEKQLYIRQIQNIIILYIADTPASVLNLKSKKPFNVSITS
ncbi:hypothetical protein CIAM_27500 [Citrobacter amalonaticus]|jgi:hypothetical protein|nr:hypothetical protein CIAM_27500 [Citrobacter amalonaticus]